MSLQSEAPTGTLETMALTSAMNVKGGHLTESDKKGMYAMLAKMEEMAASIRQRLTSAEQGVSSSTLDATAERQETAMKEVGMEPAVADPAATTPVTESAEEQNEVKRKSVTEARAIGAPSTPPPDERSEPDDVVMATAANGVDEKKTESGDVTMAD